jgi:DNA-binding transcriptional regulator YiaG
LTNSGVDCGNKPSNMCAMNGKRIKALRLRLGMTRDEFGQALGVSRIAVWRWEEARGEAKRKPSRPVELAIKRMEKEAAL